MPNPIKKKIDAAIKKMSEARAGKLADKSQAARKAGEYQKSTQLANKATKVELRQMGRDIRNAKRNSQ